MIRSEKYVKALSALQQIIIRARFLASKEEQKTKVVGLLDAAEELPRMIADDEDRTETFAAALQAISERYPYCRNIFVDFSGETGGSSDEPAKQLQLV
ncbi:MAG: hypothetical protein MOB07_02315 [Acidobacteria bacterium]|nr:hypothetical protein [Acidobacteriota bacterium]